MRDFTDQESRITLYVSLFITEHAMFGKATEYTHHELNREVVAIAGRYVLVKEVRLPFHGREVLYVVGYAIFDTTCCGIGGLAYALVPGFILDWKGTRNEDNLAVSLVEPVHDETVQEEIRRLIENKEMVNQIRFQY
jgi:predicted HTH domain antitoxin